MSREEIGIKKKRKGKKDEISEEDWKVSLKFENIIKNDF